MKKCSLGFLLACLLCVLPMPIKAVSTVQLHSTYALVADLNTLQTIYGEKEDDKLYPASMTKVLTVLTAMDQIDDLDKEVTITPEMLVGLEDGVYSLAGFLNGEVITMRDLLYGAMLPSGADACQALAVELFGSEENMVDEMNKKAQSIGMEHSHFTNTVGMHDDDHYTTASDLALLMKAAWSNEEIKTAMSTKTYSTSSSYYHGEGLSLKNTWMYQLQAAGIDDTHVIGGKTGYTPEAGYCFFGVCEIDEQSVIVVVAKYEDDEDSVGMGSMLDIENLCTFVEEQKQPVFLAEKGDLIAELDLRYTFHEPLSLTTPCDLIVWVDQTSDEKPQIQVENKKSQAPVAKGELIAEAVILYDDKEAARVAILADQTIDRDITAVIVDTLTDLVWPYGLVIMLAAAAGGLLIGRKKKLRKK